MAAPGGRAPWLGDGNSTRRTVSEPIEEPLVVVQFERRPIAFAGTSLQLLEHVAGSAEIALLGYLNAPRIHAAIVARGATQRIAAAAAVRLWLATGSVALLARHLL